MKSDVGAVAEALTAVTNAAKPFLDESLAQRYEKESVARIRNWQEAVRTRDVRVVGPYIDRLLIDAGRPVGSVGVEYIKLHVEYVDELTLAAIELVKTKKELASLLAVVKRPN